MFRAGPSGCSPRIHDWGRSGGERRATVAADDGTAQRKISVEILAGRCASVAGAFERFLQDGSQWFIAHEQPAVTACLLVAVADWNGEHIVATLYPRLHLLQRLMPILQALQLTLRGDDGFDELAFGRVLELEIEALHRRVVCRQFLPQLQVKDGVPREALQVIEDHDAVFVPALLQEPEHGNHAGALHEVAAAGNIAVEYRFDYRAASIRVVPAAMLLAVQRGCSPSPSCFCFLLDTRQ